MGIHLLSNDIDLETHTTFIYRDIIFHETIFFSSFISHSSLTQQSFFVLPKTILDLVDSLFYNSPYSSTNLPSPTTFLPIQQSTRSRKQPSYLQDYHCQLIASHPLQVVSLADTSSSIKFSLDNFLSYNKLSPSHKHFSLTISSHREPTSFSQAIHILEWQTTMNAEIKTLEDNKTWTLTPLPIGNKSIACKWVYRIKYKADGSIERYKARLVAKKYTQVERFR